MLYTFRLDIPGLESITPFIRAQWPESTIYHRLMELRATIGVAV